MREKELSRVFKSKSYVPILELELESWMSHNALDSVKGIEKCRTLKEVYLGYNKLTKTTGLDKLVQLEILWLDCNHIDR